MALRENMTNLMDISHWRLTPYQILSLGFAGLIFVGAILLTSPLAAANGVSVGFIDALFTATSAACVTGLVVVDTGTRYSVFGQTVIIILIQAGGLGIMTMATLMALVTGKRIQLRERLLLQEALNQLTVSGIVRLTQYIIKTTLLIELVGGVVLTICWYGEMGSQAIYFGFWHAIAGFCNAGFDLFGGYRSLTGYVSDGVVTMTMATLIIFGGLGFSVLYDVWENRKFKRFSLHTKVVLTVTLFLLVAGTLVIFLLESGNSATLQNLPMGSKILGSFFQSVAARTGGYHTVNIGRMADGTLFFIIMLMLIGASPGSTGGGVKTSTVGVLVAATWALVRGKTDVEMFKRRLPTALVYKAFAIGFMVSLLIIFVTMMLSITEKAPFLHILFEVVSAFGNVGLSTGITPTLTIHGKLWLMVTMFAGRVGPATLALALALRQGRTLVQYPEDKVIIG